VQRAQQIPWRLCGAEHFAFEVDCGHADALHLRRKLARRVAMIVVGYTGMPQQRYAIGGG